VTTVANHLTVNAGTTHDVNMNNLNLSSLQDVNITGHTVVLNSVNFGNTVNIWSDSGNVASGINTGAAVVRGDINMINGVMFEGTLLSDQNRGSYINPSEGSSGIFTHSNNN
jgi:hypothetical protein